MKFIYTNNWRFSQSVHYIPSVTQYKVEPIIPSVTKDIHEKYNSICNLKGNDGLQIPSVTKDNAMF